MGWFKWMCLLWVTWSASCSRDKNTEDENHVPVHTDTLATLQQIKTMGDLVYDHPREFSEHADSFLSIINHIQPHNQEASRSYQLLLLNAGYALSQDAQILKSVAVYEKALAYYFENPDKSIDFLEYYVKPLGSLYTMIGDLQKASSLQYMALEKAHHDPEQKAGVYANLAITIRQLQLWDSVIYICHSGLAFVLPNSITASRFYNELAECYLAKENADSAFYYNRLAVAILATHSPNAQPGIWLATAKSIEGRIFLLEKNYENASGSISEAISLLEAGMHQAHQREKAKLYELRGSIWLENGKMMRAVNDFRTAIRYLKPGDQVHYPDNTITDCYFGLAKCMRILNIQDSAITYYVNAVENDYVVQQFIITKESSYHNSAQIRTLLEEASALIWTEYQRSGNDVLSSKLAYQLLWITELSKGRQLINEISRSEQWKSSHALSDVQVKLRFLYGSLAGNPDSALQGKIKKEIRDIIFRTALSEKTFEKRYEIPDFTAFRDKINDISKAASVISWQMNDTGLCWVTVVHNGTIKSNQLQKGIVLHNEIDALMHTYFYNGPQAYNNNPSLYFERSSALFSKILPVWDICTHEKWVVSLDGSLHAVPLEALTVNHQFVIESKQVNAVYTLLSYNPGSSFPGKEIGVNVFAKTKHSGAFRNLDYIPEEIKSIKSVVSTNVYENEQAGFQKISEALASPDILHISTHAVSDDDGLPYLVFDEKISIDDLQFANAQAPLAVLSACETARGKIIEGEGMESLNKAFLGTGVKGVIAARWPVNDASAPDFIRQFYRCLEEEHSPEKALRTSKLQFIRGKSSGYLANPWEWAALSCYTGDEMHLYLKTNRLSLYGMLIAVVILVALLWSVRSIKLIKAKRKG